MTDSPSGGRETDLDRPSLPCGDRVSTLAQNHCQLTLAEGSESRQRLQKGPVWMAWRGHLRVTDVCALHVWDSMMGRVGGRPPQLWAETGPVQKDPGWGEGTPFYFQ